MKLRHTALLLISVCCQCLATEQMPDVFTQNENKGELVTSWAYKSPLEHYFSKSKIESPFDMMHTANYRGHVAHWELIDEKLYLKAIMVDAQGDEYVKNELGLFSEKLEPYELSKMFREGITEHGKFADWFDGEFLVLFGAKKKNLESGGYEITYDEYRMMYFEAGVLVEARSYTADEYYSALKQLKPDETLRTQKTFTVTKRKRPKYIDPSTITVASVVELAEQDFSKVWGLVNKAAPAWEEKHVPELLGAMLHTNNNVRWCASYALRFIDIEENITELHKASLIGLNDSDYRVRSACLELLAQYHLETEEFLINKLNNDPSDRIRNDPSIVTFTYKHNNKISK